MKSIQHPAELRSYYRERQVVAEYLPRRTGQPRNGFLHERQVRFLDRVIAERRPRAVLEVAPGPARLTAEIAQVPLGLAVDFSPEMLEMARRRVAAAGKSWFFVRGDAFALPVAAGGFDLIFSLRFVRHFSAPDRARLYREFAELLRPRGALVLDAPSEAGRDPARRASHAVYDELYTPAKLQRELGEHGFHVVRLEGVIRHWRVQRFLNRLRLLGLAEAARHLIRAVEHLPGWHPSFWMVLAERE